MRTIFAAIIAVLALIGASAASAKGAAASYESQTFAMNAAETLAAERRQANSELIRLRGIIDARDARIRKLEGNLRSAGGANRTLSAELGKLKQESADEKERYTAELARRDDEYARERQILLQAADNILETDDGLEALRLFNTGEQADWERAKAVLDEIDRVRSEAEAVQQAERRRAIAVLYLEKRARGQERVEATIARWEAVIATGKADFYDWTSLATLYEGELRLDLALAAIEQALRLAQDEREVDQALWEKSGLLAEMGRNSEAIIALTKLVERGRLSLKNYESEPENRNILDILEIESDILEIESLSIYLRTLALRLCIMYRCDESQALFDELDHVERAKQDFLNNTRAVEDTATSLSATTGSSVLDGLDFPLATGEISEAGLDTGLPVLMPESPGLSTFPDYPRLPVGTLHTDLLEMGTRLINEGQLPEGLQKYREALDISRELTRKFPGSVRELRDLQLNLSQISNVLRMLDDKEELVRLQFESLEIHRTLAAIPGGDVETKTDLASSLRDAGDTLLQLGRAAEAKEKYSESLDIDRRLALSFPTSIPLRISLADALIDAGNFSLDTNENGVALEAFQEARTILRELAAMPGAPMWANVQLAGVLLSLEELSADPQYLNAALPIYERTVKFQRRAVSEGKLTPIAVAMRLWKSFFLRLQGTPKHFLIWTAIMKR